MGFLDRFTKKDLRNKGLPGTAVLRSVPEYAGHRGDEDSDALTFSAGYRLDLEVRIEGRDPYAVSQTFKIPKKWWDITTGVELPVWVDAQNPDRVLIDWDAFGAAGGEQHVEDAGDQYRSQRQEAVKESVGQNPVLAQGAQTTINHFLAAVKAGGMTVDEFNGYVDEYVNGGMLTPEQGEAAKAQAAG